MVQAVLVVLRTVRVVLGGGSGNPGGASGGLGMVESGPGEGFCGHIPGSGLKWFGSSSSWH